MSLSVFEVTANGEDFQNLVSEHGWRLPTKFITGKKVVPEGDIFFRLRCEQEDVDDEQNLIDLGDSGDVAMAHTRAEVGVGDCAYVIGFSTALVLSRLAREVLEQSIGQLGQFIPVTVESERWYIFCLLYTSPSPRDEL